MKFGNIWEWRQGVAAVLLDIRSVLQLKCEMLEFAFVFHFVLSKAYHSGLFKWIERCVWRSKLNVALMIVVLILMICLRMMAVAMVVSSYARMMGRSDIVTVFVHFQS